MLWTIIVLFWCLIISSLVHHIAKLIKIPYTILLFIVWILLVPLDTYFWFDLVNTLVLTPELLFFVFLPVLIFEAWYHIKYEQLAKNYVSIRWLAIFWLSISTCIIWFWGQWILSLIWFDVPWQVMLLFWVIISSTDPVAVLSIFKELGVPKRLWLIFEWESLFNDGIAVAVFLVLLEIYSKWVITWWQIREWFWIFLMMVIWWIILWTIMGIIFSQVIKYIKNNEHVEITLTMVLAHVVFICAEYMTTHTEILWIDIKISWVIATAYAAIIMWNYGKSKISPKVEAYMDKFWSFFSFVTNSLVFLMMWLMFKHLDGMLTTFWKPILVTLFLVIIARAVSIYIPMWILNVTKSQTFIPKSRQHLLSWGSLRWALWLMLVLLIPNDFMIPWWTFDIHPKWFILVLTVCSIMFSLIVQWLTITWLIKKLNINWLVDLERFEHLESHILVYHKIIEKIHSMNSAYEISPENYDALVEKYKAKINEATLQMQVFLWQLWDQAPILLKNAITLHALWIEKEYLHDMYTYNEVTEQVYHERKAKIEKQISRVEWWLPQIRWFKTSTDISPKSWDPIERLVRQLSKCKDSHHNEYIISRTKYIITAKVIENLEKLRKIDFWYDKRYVNDVIDLYQKFNTNASQEIDKLMSTNSETIEKINRTLLNKWLMRSEEKLIKDLYHKEMITEKIYQQFMEEIDEEVWKKY